MKTNAGTQEVIRQLKIKLRVSKAYRKMMVQCMDPKDLKAHTKILAADYMIQEQDLQLIGLTLSCL